MNDVRSLIQLQKLTKGVKIVPHYAKHFLGSGREQQMVDVYHHKTRINGSVIPGSKVGLIPS